jgi:hypothetical protein
MTMSAVMNDDKPAQSSEQNNLTTITRSYAFYPGRESDLPLAGSAAAQAPGHF